MNRSTRSRNGNSGGYNRKPRRPAVPALLVVVVLLVAVTAGVLALMNPGGGGSRPDPTATPRSVDPALESDAFYEGVSVDEVALGGLTKEQARQQVEARQQEYLANQSVMITKDGQTILQINAAETAWTFDTDAVLEAAWKQGREGTAEERLAAIGQLKTAPVKLTTAATCDPSALEQKVRDLTAPYAKPAVNAAYAGFDITQPAESRLKFTPDTPGEKVDADALWAAVKTAFETRAFGEVPMQVVPVPADVTLDSLKNDLQLLTTEPIGTDNIDQANKGHTFTTRIKNAASQRLTNIKLAGDAVSGMLMPGEELSVNGKTGDRTAAQGYKIAPIDRSGVVDQGLGGGVCQVSGTLYNAAIRYGGKYEVEKKPDPGTPVLPGLAVTMRDSHSLPSAYLKTGTDATVDIATKKDLKIRNDFDKPVVILLYYDKDSKGHYYEHCDIYGPPLPDGATYTLIRKNVKTLSAKSSAPAKTVYSKYAEPGKPRLIQAQKGYSVDVYIQKTVNGSKSEYLAYHDDYKPQPPIWYIYVGEVVPTPTPPDLPPETATVPPETSATEPAPTDPPAA